ncbi:MAG: hypothetical protein ACYC49_10570 [Ignavibacteriaceae bacterium]|nr:hypothetical protein [Ignavibacteriaceae bacterium]
MSNVQSMLAIGAMIILSFISLSFNSAVLNTSTIDFQNKVSLTAISLADNMLEEIKSKSFDQATLQFPTNNLASLTPPSSLGPEAGEVYPNFNDVDDYNGFIDTVAAPYFETYYLSCKVEYVSGNSPDVVSSVQTFDKRVTVTVTSPYLKNNISIAEIFTLR